MGELIVCAAVSRGEPYPDHDWWREAGIARLDSVERRRWWGQWATFGWTTAIADGAGRALSWALGFIDDTPPVLPRHLEDGSRATADLREECAAILREALARPLPDRSGSTFRRGRIRPRRRRSRPLRRRPRHRLRQPSRRLRARPPGAKR